MYQYELKIPIERVAVLVGEKGSVKKRIQKTLDIQIKIDSKEGDVTISGEDSVNLMIAQDIIKAISRGFNPDIAFQLLNEKVYFELIDISIYSKSKKNIIRLKGRAIGEKGKGRRLISKLTNTEICVYGKTIGIIGYLENVELAKRAYDKLLNGSPHNKVFSFIEKEIKNLR